MTVRVGVIGTGIMGADHISTLHRQVTGAAVTMVADLDLARARAVATAVPECLRVVRAEQEAVEAGGPGLVSVGFMRRFDPGYLELKSALEAGACGTPLLVHCVSRGVASAPGTTSESSVTNSAIHELDAVPWLLDAPVVEVSWHAPRAAGAAAGMQDPQLILLRTADGALTTVEVFLNAGYGYDIRCEIVGDRGTIALANPARVVTDADRLELQAWVDAVAAGHPSPLASAHDGLIASAVADAVIASMGQDGRRAHVELP